MIFQLFRNLGKLHRNTDRIAILCKLGAFRVSFFYAVHKFVYALFPVVRQFHGKRNIAILHRKNIRIFPASYASQANHKLFIKHKFIFFCVFFRTRLQFHALSLWPASFSNASTVLSAPGEYLLLAGNALFRDRVVRESATATRFLSLAQRIQCPR
jgi:hypothetical protein